MGFSRVTISANHLKGFPLIGRRLCKRHAHPELRVAVNTFALVSKTP